MLEYNNLAGLMSEPTPPSLVELFRGYAQEVRDALPDADWPTRVYALALRVLNSNLGSDWAERHVLGNSDPTPFFRNGAAAAGDEVFHRARVVDLAETIINLYKSPGLSGVLREMQLDHIEDRFAELEVGKILRLAGLSFNYVSPGGPRGSSYDLEITTPAGKVCADVKCRVESSTPDGGAILNTLKYGRTQLPANEMGAIFLKLPQTWAADGDIAPLLPMLEEAAERFLRGTKRVVAVIMYFNIVRVVEDRIEIFNVYKQVTNPKHRFEVDGPIHVLPQDHAPFISPRPDWVRLAEITR